MSVRTRAYALASTLTLAVAAPGVASAAGLLDLTGLTAVRAYEATFSLTDGTGTFATGDPRLVQRLDPLTGANRDFGGFPGDENYDIFVSNADGQLDANGHYITVEGNCVANSGCFNVNAISLFFGATEVFADFVTTFTYGRPGSFIIPGSEALVVDVGPNNLSTFPRFGDTIGLPLSARMAVTVGFSAFPEPTAGVPEPATWSMMILGFGGVGALVRRRRPGLSPAAAAG